jgi:hypothetical protein
MNKKESVPRHNVVPLMFPVLFSVISVFFSVVLFLAMRGTCGTARILPGLVIPLPEIVCIFIFYHLTSRTEQTADVCTDVSSIEETVQEGSAGTEEAGLKETVEEQGKKIQVQCRIIAERMHLFSPVLEELNVSISQNLSSTTEPISAELLRIRELNTEFLQSIRSYDDEVRNRTSVTKLEHESEVFEQDMDGLYGTVRDVFAMLQKYIEEQKSISDRIGRTAQSISELSEQIRILSFNASIEAARAGQAGAGFRVIAAEIKRLSAGTDERLKEIQNTLKDTQQLFGELQTEIAGNREAILRIVSDRRRGFSTFKETLDEYFQKLELLYRGVTGIIDSLTKSMNVISPVVQLHEITSQEIGNMGLVVSDMCTWAEDCAEEVCGKTAVNPDKNVISRVTADIRKRLTTEKELNALGRGIRRTVPDADIDLGINNQSIELF